MPEYLLMCAKRGRLSDIRYVCDWNNTIMMGPGEQCVPTQENEDISTMPETNRLTRSIAGSGLFVYELNEEGKITMSIISMDDASDMPTAMVFMQVRLLVRANERLAQITAD